MNFSTALGFIAGFLTTASFLPQVVKCWKTRSAGDLSGVMYAVFSSGVLLWLIYGVAVRDTPIIVWNAVTLALVILILGMKIRFGR
jgi:MtN3 and saliva related transmembrane protein